MIRFTDTNIENQETQAKAAFLSGVFDGTEVAGWCFSRSEFDDRKLTGLDCDLEMSRSDKDDKNSPLVLVAKTATKGDAHKCRKVCTWEVKDGWQTLSVCADPQAEEQLLSSVKEKEFQVLGGDCGSPLVLVLETPLPCLPPPTRILHHLPATHIGGLNPFLTAIGAEPVALMDSAQPLLDKLANKGVDTVGVLSRAGAFLWTLDVKGRLDLEALASNRIDEDVVLPITAGLPAGEHIELTSDLSTLLPRARQSDLDIAFIMNPPSQEQIGLFAFSDVPPAHAYRFPCPSGLEGAD